MDKSQKKYNRDLYKKFSEYDNPEEIRNMIIGYLEQYKIESNKRFIDNYDFNRKELELKLEEINREITIRELKREHFFDMYFLVDAIALKNLYCLKYDTSNKLLNLKIMYEEYLSKLKK